MPDADLVAVSKLLAIFPGVTEEKTATTPSLTNWPY